MQVHCPSARLRNAGVTCLGHFSRAWDEGINNEEKEGRMEVRLANV